MRLFFGVFVLLNIIGFNLSPAFAGERIISLKPNITDILLRLGVKEELVGVTTYCTVPADLSAVPRVADYIKPNLEKVVMARPTLIVSSKENSDQKEMLRLSDMGFRIEWVSFQSLDEIYTSIDALAGWTGKEAEGNALISDLKNRLASLEARARTLPNSPRILWVAGQRPLVAVGRSRLFSDFFDVLHIQNLMKDSVLSYPQLSKEAVFALDPDWIIDISTAEANARVGAFYQEQYAQLPAVRDGHLLILSASHFLPGPPLWDGMETVMSVILDSASIQK